MTVKTKKKDCRTCDKPQELIFNSSTFGLQYDVKRLNDQDYIVVPVVMAVEGIMNNAFYSAEELSKNVAQWNNKPIPITHPKDSNGTPISANTKENIKKYSVGQMMNVQIDNKEGETRLIGEAWINTSRATDISPELVSMLENNKQIQVSTGLFTDATLEPGIFKGNSYDWVVSNFRADHLAILLNEEAACNVNDGCGLNVNKAGVLLSRVLDKIKKPFMANEASFREIRESAEAAINTAIKAPAGVHIFINEIFEDNFVFEVWDDESGNAELFRIGYTLNNSEDVVLKDDVQQVKRKTDFVSVEAEQPKISLNETDGDKTKTPNEGDIKMDELVNKLINNAKTAFTEDDREYLKGLSEERLKTFDVEEQTEEKTPDTNEKSEDCDCKGDSKVSTNETEDKTDAEVPKVNASDIVASLKAVAQNVNDLKESIPTLVANAVDAKIAVDQKTPLINSLKANGCALSEVALNAMSVEDLHEMHKMTTNANYGIGGSGVNANAKSREDLTEMTAIDWSN